VSSADTALHAVETIVARGDEADATLREVVAALHEQGGYAWAGIFFIENGRLALGPSAGTPDDRARTTVAVAWQGDPVAELAVDGAPDADRPTLERIASLVSGQCLVGWDTGGEAWEP